jgi:NAD(P)-dependent dehydrogenase (short-subunit alcohol dehydrogenase family)
MNGKHVVITGAAGGLGPAVAEAFKAAGAALHTPTREQLDLTDEAAVTKYYQSLPPLWASVHIAGGFAMAPLLDTALKDLEGQWRLNTVTAFLTCREAARSIKQSKQGGRIVNVGSRIVLAPPAGKSAYVAAKSAVVALTKSMAAELHSDGIFVNAVLPDTIDTPANRAAMPKADFSKWTAPASIGKTILWLCSKENTSVTGAEIPV